MSNENNNINENENINEVGLIENENGDILLGQLWFDKNKGVVTLTCDMFQIYNPSDEFLGYVQKALDLFQEGLYKEVMNEIEEEKEEERKAFIERELKDLEQMKKEIEEGEEEEIKDIDKEEIK